MSADRVQWLRKFDGAMRLGYSAQASLAYVAAIQHEAGNQVLSAHLYRISEAIEESLSSANAAVSQMVSEEVRASGERLNETFLAILKTTLQGDNEVAR